jgi:TRAP-type mannitol/chloroaromatic compound transport system substrate-binding protein
MTGFAVARLLLGRKLAGDAGKYRWAALTRGVTITGDARRLTNLFEGFKLKTLRTSTASLAGLMVGAFALGGRPGLAADIPFRSFSASAAIGPPAEAYAAKLQNITRIALGAPGELHFVRLPGLPEIPAPFGGSILTAVAAGAAGGGYDAAYISGSDLNKAWGFLFNSAMPFGPTFDEYLGFLYGKSIVGQQSGLELMQGILDLHDRNVVAIPIVGSSEQLSGYFPEPIGDVKGHRGIGLEGLCQKGWTLRYLPPGENVLGMACDDLAARGVIPAKRLAFIAAVAGTGSLVSAVKAGTIQGFEFSTPLDDVSQLFNTADNPGTVGVRYVHVPGWQQEFLITYMLINKQVWNGLSPAQQALASSVARDNVLSSFAENMRQQGAALKVILEANRNDTDPNNDLVLVNWPRRDLERLSAATINFLNARVNDAALPAADRQDLATILEALRNYVRDSDRYWDERRVNPQMRFDSWKNPAGEPWENVSSHEYCNHDRPDR